MGVSNLSALPVGPVANHIEHPSRDFLRLCIRAGSSECRDEADPHLVIDSV